MTPRDIFIARAEARLMAEVLRGTPLAAQAYEAYKQAISEKLSDSVA